MLTNRQKRHLQALAHHRKPVIIVGANGLSEAVMKEMERALDHHELIKVRLNAADRERRSVMITQIGQALEAELVQCVGHVATWFRSNPEIKRIELP